MDSNQYEDLIKILTNSVDNFIPIEFLKEQLNSNFSDKNLNNYFHYLSRYSFKEFYLNNKNNSKKICNKKEYNILLNQYIEQIKEFTNILISLNCDINQKNIDNQSPLEICLIKKNYYLAKEYLNYYYYLDFIFINNGNIINSMLNEICLKEDCVDFLLYLFNIEDEKISKQRIENFLNKKINNNNLIITPIISILKDFNENIYKKYIQIVKINCLEYLQKGNKDEYILLSDENIKKNILEKSLIEFNDFCLTKFYNLIILLIDKKADFNFIENNSNEKDISAFMYLMAYPCFPDISSFIIQQNININYQDNKGRIALIHLINNKNNIIKICENIYNEAFNSLINDKSIDISIRDENGLSPFLLCLINEYYKEAEKIYDKYSDKFIQEFNLDFLFLFIIKISTNEFNNSFISNIQKSFKEENVFDIKEPNNNRTLLHYYFMFISNIYKDLISTLNLLLKIITEKNKKDIYNRNCLFYLFIDFYGDPKKENDPYEILDYCLKNKLFKFDINEKDIFDKNLIFYAVQSGFILSVKILISNGAILDDYFDTNDNNIYSNALISNGELFFILCMIKKITNFDLYQRINIFQSNYDCFIENAKEFKKEQKNCQENNIIKLNNEHNELNMYDFFHNPELILEKVYNDDEDEDEDNRISKIYNYRMKVNSMKDRFKNIKIKFDTEFTVFDLLTEEQKNIINKFIQDNLNLNFENPMKPFALKINDKSLNNIKLIIKNPEHFIQIIKANKKVIYSDSIFKYLMKNNKKDIFEKIKLVVNKIDLCKINLDLNKNKDLINVLNILLDENKNIEIFLKLKNKENQTIFHILSVIPEQKNESLNNIYNKLKNIKINNLFDINGNTPMYYACQILNKKFIEIFSNFCFDNKQNKNIDTILFVETKNNNTPLEELYKKLNLKDNKLLDLIIEITLKEKFGYMKYIMDYLIDNYNSSYKKLLSEQFKTNISHSKYINKIIGIYQYLKNELNYNLNFEEENGNELFMKNIIKYNLSFINDILLPEKSQEFFLNRVNKNGKSLFHLVIESNIQNKMELILSLLNKGFNYNIKDNKELLPIDYAYLNHDKEIFEILKNKYYNEGVPLKINLFHNFYKDSDILYKESISISSKFQQCDDLFGLVIDKYKNLDNKVYAVCVDNESIPYNAVLLRGNMDYYYVLLNKYILQIIQEINTKKYIVVFSTQKSNEEFEFTEFQDAENKFKEIFKQKTNNNWDEVKKDKTKFITNYFKYFYFDYDFEQEKDIYQYLKIAINNLKIKNKIKYNGNYKIRDLIYYFAIKAYKNRFDNEKDTIEIIKEYKKRSLEDSIFLLNKILKIIEKGSLDKSKNIKKAYLLNCYLQLIPYSLHKDDNNLFKTEKDIHSEKGRITTYYYIENVLKIFLGAIKNLDEMHPLDYIINSLGCNIIELNEKTEENKYIKNFLINTGAYSVKNIFKITESRNDINFNPKNFKKRYIFFHGTKTKNLIGILSEGLKVSPAQAEFSGNKYGKGIYLTDSYNVAIHYSMKGNEINDKRYILLVEAALGKINKDYNLYHGILENENVYITEEGYGIFKFSKYLQRKCIIVVKNAMNVRVKYIVEI